VELAQERARPIITASQPVVCSSASARARLFTSPEAITGTSTSVTSSAVSAWSAVPVYICWAERGWSVSAAAPASTSRGPAARASREPLRSPRRIFTVTGTSTAPATASTMRAACAPPSASSVQPAPVFVTLRTGQPMLMSTRSAPAATTMRAASASSGGSDPKICTASGRSSEAMRR
jgi:hypothetical protein